MSKDLTNSGIARHDIIIYNTDDGKASVSLFAKDGKVWMNQNQLAELFATSIPNISMHISNILKEGELANDSVIKDYLTTASDGKEYKVALFADQNDMEEIKKIEGQLKKRKND